MKKFKFILLLIIAAFIGLFVFQNLAVFTSPIDLKLNLGVKHYELLQVKSFLVFLGFVLLGFLFALFLALGGLIKTKRALKASNEKAKDMEAELNMLKGAPATSESAIEEDSAPEEIVPEESSSEGSV
jgi:hypothetical protein